MKFLRALPLAAAAVLAAGFLLHASGCADSAFYQPTKTVYSTPAQAAGIAYEDVTFKSADGTRLTGWFMPAQGVADQLITIEGGGHIAAMVYKDDSYRDALVKFFEDALNRRP